MNAENALHIIVLTPVFNDWPCARRFLADLSQVSQDLALEHGLRIDAIIVDDGSQTSYPENLTELVTGGGLQSVSVIRLQRNVGHQRAICIGLCHVSEAKPCDLVVVMDADGEDRPQDIPQLLETCRAHDFSKIVFAARARRNEGITFAIGYRAYKYLHRLLTGIPVRFGNFSIVPAEICKSLPLVWEMWNHYAAAVVKARLPYVAIPIHRGHRYTGQSSMRLTGLVMHGVSAMSVFAERISVRLMAIAAIGWAMASITAIVAACFWRLSIMSLAAIGLIEVVVCGLGLLMLGLFALAIHAFRGTAGFLPKRDYLLFIRSVTNVPIVSRG